jgi:hypothetical protein
MTTPFGVLGEQTIFSSIMEQGHQVAECERASLFIVDMEKRDLWSVNDVGVRIPLGAGFAGAAVRARLRSNRCGQAVPYQLRKYHRY